MDTLKEFWISQVLNSQANFFENLLATEWANNVPTKVDVGDDYPILLASNEMELVAQSQMFFEEPWCNIEYEAREAESDRLYNEYRKIVAAIIGNDGIDMDGLFKLNRQTMYDEFPDVWDSPVAYELGERVHLWLEEGYTTFLAIFQEDKELPIEVRFGRFNADDMQVLASHMTQFSAA